MRTRTSFLTLLLVCAAIVAIPAAAQDADDGAATQKVAVYVAGYGEASGRQALATFVTEALIRSGKYTAIERSDRFVEQIDREHVAQRSGAVDDAQISELGKQSGVDVICVIDVTPVRSSSQVSARLINVETAQVLALGVASDVRIASTDEIRRAANEIVGKLLGETPESERPLARGEAEVFIIGPGGNFSGGTVSVTINGENKGSMCGDCRLRVIVPAGTHHLSVKWQGEGAAHELARPLKFSVKQGKRATFRVSMAGMFGPVRVAKSNG